MKYRPFWLFLYFLFLSVSGFSNCEINIQPHLSAQSIPHLWQVIDSLENCPQQSDSLGMLYRKLGICYYLKKEHLDSAIFCAKKAIKLWENSDYQTSLEMGLAYDNLGIFQTSLGNARLAKNAFFSAITIFKKSEHAEHLGRVYWRLGDLFLNTFSEYDQAKLYYEEGIKWAKKAAQHSAMLQRKNWIGLSNIYLAFDESEKSILASDSALQILEDRIDRDLQVIFSNKGIAYKNLKQWNNAEKYYRKALNFSLEYGISQNLSTIYANLSNTLRKKGDFAEALKLCKERLKVAEAENDLETLAQIYDNMGEVYFDQKKYHKALAHFHQSIKILLPKYDGLAAVVSMSPQDLATAPYKSDLLIYLPDKARVLVKLYEKTGETHWLAEAQHCFYLTDKLIDYIRFQHNDTDSKFFWRKQVKPIYENALEVAFLLQDEKMAYHYFEKSKSILLLDAFNEAAAQQEIPSSIQEKEYELKAVLLTAQRTKDRTKELLIDQQIAQFMDTLAQKYPKYHEIRYQANTLPFEKAKQQVPNEKQLHIHWFMGDTAVYFLAFNSNETYFEQIPNSPSIKRQLADFCQWFQKSYLIENETERYFLEAHQLFKTLFPAKNFDPTKYTSITFFADGSLNFVPYDALIVSPANKPNSQFSDAAWWAKTTKINYAYSATVLAKQLQNATKNQGLIHKSVGFAPFSTATGNGLFALNSEDLLWLQDHIAGDYFFGEQANVVNFQQANLENGLLHLSTHATAGSNADNCQIYFFQDSLQLADLYLRTMNVDLVVLSACETGIGEIAKGEGLLSLSRGFTHAGAASLIAGLWKVNDRSTSEILVDFYKNLQQNLTKSEALYQAKMTLLNGDNQQMKSPYYWSSLVYSGADGQLKLAKTSFLRTYQYWLIGGLFLVIGIVFLFRKIGKT